MSPMARATASSSSRTTCSATRAVRAVRVTGRRISTWGMSCSGPMLACGRDVQPPISSTGARASDALALAGYVIPDRLDVAALETEDAVNATGFEKARDPGGGSGIVGVEVDGVAHVGSE